MAQATDSNTTIPVDFSSPVVSASRDTVRSIAARITDAHADLIERLRRLPPNRIDPRLQADEADLECRADILRCHLRAVADYVSEYARDTAGTSWSVQIDRKWIDGAFRDLIGDIVGPIETAAETVRQEGTWRAA